MEPTGSERWEEPPEPDAAGAKRPRTREQLDEAEFDAEIGREESAAGLGLGSNYS